MRDGRVVVVCGITCGVWYEAGMRWDGGGGTTKQRKADAWRMAAGGG